MDSRKHHKCLHCFYDFQYWSSRHVYGCGRVRVRLCSCARLHAISFPVACPADSFYSGHDLARALCRHASFCAQIISARFLCCVRGRARVRLRGSLRHLPIRSLCCSFTLDVFAELLFVRSPRKLSDSGAFPLAPLRFDMAGC